MASKRRNMFHKNKTQETTENEWSEGMEMSLFKEVAHRMNLNWTLQPSKGYGVRHPNGTWVGGIHMDISVGEGDIAFAQIWLTTNDIHAVDFTYPLDLHCLRFIVPREKIVGIQWFSIVKTYEWFVWSIVGGCAVVVTLCAKAVLRARQEMGFELRKSSVAAVFYQITTMLTQTNYPKPVKVHGSMRPVILSWILFSLLLSIGYCSNLVSVLTRTKYTHKLNTVEDLVRGNCHWGINGNPENDLALKNDLIRNTERCTGMISSTRKKKGEKRKDLDGRHEGATRVCTSKKRGIEQRKMESEHRGPAMHITYDDDDSDKKPLKCGTVSAAATIFAYNPHYRPAFLLGTGVWTEGMRQD
ncbi:hypothetical protein AAG570_008912 [Ranatra chinensis]|uniref:Uncharacterized protein n=1 Tax=Ranatra chinensis TaxID=642074 RepID=A0ABD0YSK9_9HEMI